MRAFFDVIRNPEQYQDKLRRRMGWWSAHEAIVAEGPPVQRCRDMKHRTVIHEVVEVIQNADNTLTTVNIDEHGRQKSPDNVRT